ncbi:TetR/AcrR family transcriptional regulator [Vibrio sp. AND4]|uniref:TetR/AcrR family transcriptional regulator n=1 Tax=Vibrio sp. AND4 TaxID=314289 RepID=UPI00015F0E20|nr:TetR/AcrR family transcriptional regulator [Vibrio sp. AND4]EDP57866.1 transcriptional regulator, TetR family protein [Vibrio sp. AND4]
MRSAEFDKEQVLRAAIAAFVSKGYNKTSMQDLKKATGLHPGSIYCAFENKQGLLIAALEQYNKDRTGEFSDYFRGKKTILAGLKSYLMQTVTNCASSGPERVCFSQQALSELTEQAPAVEAVIAKNMADWQDGFVNVFERAQAAGEVDNSRTPKQRTHSLMMGIYGLRTFAHTHPTTDILEELAQQLFEDVCR